MRPNAAAANSVTSLPRRRIWLGIALLPVLFLLWLSARWFLAEWYYFEVERHLTAYDNHSIDFTPAQWAATEDLLNRIDALGRHDARFSHQKGAMLVRYWESLPKPEEEQEQEESDDEASLALLDDEDFLEDEEFLDDDDSLDLPDTLKASWLEAFLESVQRQPSWPYGWVDLAHYLLYYDAADERDVLFVYAFSRAMRTGPNIVGIQGSLARYSSVLYYTAADGSELGALILENLNRSLSAHPWEVERILAVLRETNTLVDFCPYLDLPNLDELARKACADLEKIQE